MRLLPILAGMLALALAGCGGIDGAAINVNAGNGPCSINISGSEVVIGAMQLACRGGRLSNAPADTVVAVPTEGVSLPVAGSVTRPAPVHVIPPPKR